MEAEPDTKTVDRRLNISRQRMLSSHDCYVMCAYSRDSIVWLFFANDLGQAALGAGREAGRPCVLATMVIRISVYRLPGT